MKLSVVIIFCDKDFKYLDSMIKMVEKFVTAEHEIILVDNRNNQEHFETNYKVVSKGSNCYIFEGRRLGLDAASGDYIWFVDVDDEIIGEVSEEDLKGRTEKILQLNYKINNNSFIKLGQIKNNIACFGPSVWSRIYKAEELREALKPLKRDIKLVNGEDRVIFDFMMNRCKSREDIYIFDDKYRYNYNLSVSAATQFKNKESLERGLIGEEELDYIYSFLPENFEEGKRKIIAINDQNRKYLSKLS